MTLKVKSILAGAACAGLVILPSLGAGSVEAAPPPAQNGWDHWGARTYQAKDIKAEDIVGTLDVQVRDGGPMIVEAWGTKARLAGLKVGVVDGRLRIDGSEVNDTDSVWDWRHWFDYSHIGENTPRDLTVRVTVPRGSDVDIGGLVGDVTVGDTQGALHLEAAVTKARIGRVASASIEIGGSGRVEIASVSGPLRLDVGGSGKIATGPIGSLKADLAGSGDAQFGSINGGLDLDIAGAADVTAARVNGPTKLSIAGSGNVKIADGTADPLHVEIMGSGNFDFGGVAVDPRVESFGSGKVHIRSYRGKLDTEGMADVKIGQ